MKILLDGRLLSDKPTGISRYSEEVIKIYQEHYGYDNVYVLTNEKLKNKNFNEIKVDYKPFNPIDFISFSFYLKKLDFDIYHSLYHSNSFFKDNTKKYITTMHDVGHKAVKVKIHSNLFKNFFITQIVDLMIKRTLKNSDVVISVSESTKSDIKKFYKKDSIFIPEGVNKIEAEDKSVKGLKTKEFFLYVGNSSPTKNLTFLLNSFMKTKTPKKLVIAGNKNYLDVKDERIINLGFVSDGELSWLYKNCEAFIFPSLYEGFGLPILEALYKKTKVYSSTAGSLKEFPKEVVKYFDPHREKELIYLLENTEKINIDWKKLPEILELYSWDSTKEKMKEKIFQQ